MDRRAWRVRAALRGSSDRRRRRRSRERRGGPDLRSERADRNPLVVSALVLRHVSLESDGPTVALTLEPGRILAVMGRPGAGKSRFLGALAGEERFARGTYERASGPWCFSGRIGGRTKLAAIAGQGGGTSPTAITDALTAVGLWERRNDPISKLTSGAALGAELLPAMAEGTGLRLVDALYDGLDPWTYALAMERTRKLQEGGAAYVIATNRVDLAREADAILVLRGGRVVFAGTPGELTRRGTATRMVVDANSQPGVRAIAAPFTVTIRQEGDRLTMEAAEGQALAARLLLEGYGNVRSVVLQEPDLADALREL
ncbi:ATP-binding cassette domain-containing protein [bacterium]|nr:MAG: ATP-binding cassette domain-containing protein [bacterium]